MSTTNRLNRNTRSSSAEGRRNTTSRIAELKKVLHPDPDGVANLDGLKKHMSVFFSQNATRGIILDDDLVLAVACLLDEIPLLVVGMESDKKRFGASLIKFVMSFFYFSGPSLVITSNDMSVDNWVGLLEQCGKEAKICKDTNGESLDQLSINGGFLVISKTAAKKDFARLYNGKYKMSFHAAIVEEADNDDFFCQIRLIVKRMVILDTIKEEQSFPIEGAVTVRLGASKGPVPPVQALKTRLLLALIGTTIFVFAVVAIFCGISGPEM